MVAFVLYCPTIAAVTTTVMVGRIDFTLQGQLASVAMGSLTCAHGCDTLPPAATSVPEDRGEICIVDDGHSVSTICFNRLNEKDEINVPLTLSVFRDKKTTG